VYFLLESYRNLLETDRILQRLAQWLVSFRSQLKCISTRNSTDPWTSRNDSPEISTHGLTKAEGLTTKLATEVSQAVLREYVEGGTYRYGALKKEQSIRLLELLPGRPDEPIVCSFQEISLLDIKPYEALTWRWGSSSMTNITVDGVARQLSTLSDLEIGLKQLRLRDRTRINYASTKTTITNAVLLLHGYPTSSV
jgi:hypothetical protein